MQACVPAYKEQATYVAEHIPSTPMHAQAHEGNSTARPCSALVNSAAAPHLLSQVPIEGQAMEMSEGVIRDLDVPTGSDFF